MRVFLFCLIALLFTPLATRAEPFFGGTRMSSFGYNRPGTQRVVYHTAMLIPENYQRTERPDTELEQEDEPTGQVQNSGSQPTVSGSRAVLRRGIAYAPESAPANVKRLIWAVNTLRNKPYQWGGGHGSFDDYGYDCSGTVSFALHHAGVLASPMAAREFMNYGNSGRGRWITVYARNGHTFAVVAGLRLDTTGFYEKDGPRWRSASRSPSGFAARHPEGL